MQNNPAESSEKYPQTMRGQAPRKEVIDFVHYIKQKRPNLNELHVLDIGRNFGNEAIYYAKEGFKVSAIHFNAETFGGLQEDFARYPNITLKVEDDNSTYDVVSSTYCLHFFDRNTFDEFWKELAHNTLKPGGYFVGNFLGVADGWSEQYSQMMTFLTPEQVQNMFNPEKSPFQGFVQLCPHKIGYEEVKKHAPLAEGGSKFWHIFSVIAQKKNTVDDKEPVAEEQKSQVLKT